MAGMTGTADVSIDKKGLIVMCADNGVVEEGISQTVSSVTAVVTDNFSRGLTSACIMSRAAGVDVFPIDIGVAADTKVYTDKIAYGTKNMLKEPAMTREEAEGSILAGIRAAKRLKKEGYQILLTGEMGIGNTTTSSAVASVLLGEDPERLSGRGAGLSDAGLQRKREVIRRAIGLWKPDPADPVDVLAKVGGFDIGGLAGRLPGRSHGAPAGGDGRIYLRGGGPSGLPHRPGDGALYPALPHVRGAGHGADIKRAWEGGLHRLSHEAGRGDRRGGPDAPSGHDPGGLPEDAGF